MFILMGVLCFHQSGFSLLFRKVWATCPMSNTMIVPLVSLRVGGALFRATRPSFQIVSTATVVRTTSNGCDNPRRLLNKLVKETSNRYDYFRLIMSYYTSKQ